MASYLCNACNTTIVRKKLDICAACINKAAQATPSELADLDSEAARPIAIVETQLRQTAALQKRVQAIIDEPKVLLCLACGENERIAKDIDVAYVLEQHVKQAKVIAAVVPAWSSLKKTGKQDQDTMTTDEMEEIFTHWFHLRPASKQRELLQKLQQLHNETWMHKVTETGQGR